MSILTGSGAPPKRFAREVGGRNVNIASRRILQKVNIPRRFSLATAASSETCEKNVPYVYDFQNVLSASEGVYPT